MLAATLCAAVVVAGASPASADPAYSVSTGTLAAALDCPASFTHTSHEPVLLVHGTTSTYSEAWGWNYADALTAAGFDVCGVDLPARAMNDIQVASEYVVYAIRHMYDQNDIKVDVIGHSQGNLEIRWAVKYWPSLQDQVDDAVLLASPNDGVTAGDLVCAFPCAAAASQMTTSSNFLDALNDGDKTPGSVSYTSIYSSSDLLVPSASAALDTATNIRLQDVCSGNIASHVGLVYEALPYLLSLDALTNTGTASPSRLPSNKCSQVYAPTVTLLDVTLNVALIAANFAAQALLSTKVNSEPTLMAYAT
ncbi:MAG: lipase [Actinophytocola sp.]